MFMTKTATIHEITIHGGSGTFDAETVKSAMVHANWAFEESHGTLAPMFVGQPHVFGGGGFVTIQVYFSEYNKERREESCELLCVLHAILNPKDMETWPRTVNDPEDIERIHRYCF